MTPYWSNASFEVYLSDYRDVLPTLVERGTKVDSIITDPPYGTTALPWDKWVPGWPEHMATISDSLWSFLPMRVVLERSSEFASWKYAQDVVWEKHNGSGFARDRFRRVHEHAVHWYRGPWRDQWREVPLVPRGHDQDKSVTRAAGKHLGKIRKQRYTDNGTRLMRSVMKAPAVRYGVHPTEKPQSILQPLISYSIPPGGVVLDPFGGSLSTLRAAHATGRRGIAMELPENEQYAEAGVKALEAQIVDGDL